MAFTVHIITPDKALPPLSADHVTLPSVDGQLGIRTGHAPIVALLKAGRVEVKQAAAADHLYVVRGGVAQMLRNELKILVEALVDPGQVSEADLVKKLDQLLAATYEDAMELTKAKAEAQWYVAQLKSAGKTVPDVSKLGL